MKERIEESWTKIEEYVSSTADFAIEQAPLVAQEIVMFGRVWNSLIVVICMAAIFGVAIGYIKAFRYCKKHDSFNWDNDDYCFASVIYGMLSLIVIIPSLIGGFTACKMAVMAWFAPRLYIIEYVTDKISG